jgi:HAD superfamily hydrolase (TIGR01549 family)
MKAWAVLFDLDGTLVQSTRLKPLRDARRWQEVYASFSLSELLPGTRQMLTATAQFAHVGVITMAPRTYAERLLRHHDLAVPVLVAYHEVARFELKPHPRPLLLAADRVGVPTSRLIYVGDEVRDIVAARHAGAYAIAYGNGGLENEPEAATAVAFARDWTEVAIAVKEITRA